MPDLAYGHQPWRSDRLKGQVQRNRRNTESYLLSQYAGEGSHRAQQSQALTTRQVPLKPESEATSYAADVLEIPTYNHGCQRRGLVTRVGVPMTSDDSVSGWILGAKCGDSAAIQALWQRYYARLVHLARRRLVGRNDVVVDEEDVALSVFACFCRAAELNRFPDLADRDQLWRLLIRITAQKVIDVRRREGRKKRGKGLQHFDGHEALANVIGHLPTASFAMMVAEESDRLLGKLRPELRDESKSIIGPTSIHWARHSTRCSPFDRHFRGTIAIR